MGRRSRVRVRKPKQRRRTAGPKLRKVAAGVADLREQLDRRTRDLDDALQQQTATSEVLRIIRQSPADAQPVFDAIVQSVSRLCGAMFGVVYLYEDDRLRIVATNNFTPAATGHLNELQQLKRPERSHLGGRAILDRKIVHVPDVLEDPEYSHELALAGGWRAVLAVPLLREGIPVGALTAAKAEAAPFSDRQIQLLKTFADQAVIAIENVRLFEAEQQRTRELSESLQQQTATADVLKVISRSTFDLSAVLNTLVESAVRLCDGYDSVILLRDGELLVFGAHHGPIPMDFDKWPLTRKWTAGRAVIDAKPVHIHDLTAAGDEFPDGHAMAARLGHRTILSVPLLRENEAIGSLTVRRSEVRPFTDKQIELVGTFADQAVIAIENARLLSELRESLQQQTATADVLKVISSSPGELEPVFQAMLENATRICEAKFGVLHRCQDGAFEARAMVGVPPTLAHELQRRALFVSPKGAPLDRLLRTKKTIHTVDATKEQTQPPSVKLGGARSHIAVPLIKAGEVVGAFTIYRTEVRPFTDKQIELVENFAAQAVIAIENTRLLSELRECYSSRPQPPTCSKSSAVRRSISRACSIRWSSRLFACARRNVVCCFVVTVKSIRVWLTLTIRANSGNFTKVIPSRQGGEPPWVVWRSKAKQFKLSTFLAIQSTRSQKRKSWVKAGPLWRCPLLREANPVGALALQRTEPRAVQREADRTC